MSETCELCGKLLGEESVSASDGVNPAVRICLECAGQSLSGSAAQPDLGVEKIALSCKGVIA